MATRGLKRPSVHSATINFGGHSSAGLASRVRSCPLRNFACETAIRIGRLAVQCRISDPQRAARRRMHRRPLSLRWMITCVRNRRSGSSPRATTGSGLVLASWSEDDGFEDSSKNYDLTSAVRQAVVELRRRLGLMTCSEGRRLTRDSATERVGKNPQDVLGQMLRSFQHAVALHPLRP